MWSALENPLKSDLKAQMDAKSKQRKNESKRDLLVYLVMHKNVQTEQR